ncbi:MAG: HEAT repeat domain-containing protein [candidate division WOR-3 bacterium]
MRNCYNFIYWRRKIEKEKLINFLKELALGVNYKIAYPGDHPIVKEQERKIIDLLNTFAEETNEISIVFLGDNVIMEDLNVDISGFPSIEIFVKRLTRLNVESLTFDTSCNEMDVGGFLDILAHPPKDIRLYDDVNTLLIERKVDNIYFNTVEFRIKAKGEEVPIGLEGMVEGKEEKSISKEEEFNLKEFFENICGIKKEDSPIEEAEKITKGLVNLYDKISSFPGEKGIGTRKAIFEKVMSSIPPEVKRFIIQDKIKLKQISSIIKSIIMSFSDEEIVEIFVSRVKALGLADAEDLLINLTPERLDRILPQIKENLKLMDVEEKYIIELEKRVKEKIEKGKGPEERISAKEGALSELSDFIKNFSEVKEEDYGTSEIANFFESVFLIKKGEEEDKEKVYIGFENFIREFVRQFGEDKLFLQSLKIRKAMKEVPLSVRKEVFFRIIKSDSPLKLTMAKILLPIMDDESVVSLLIHLVEEGEREGLEGFLSSLSSDRLDFIKEILRKEVGKKGIKDELFSKFWEKLTHPPEKIRPIGGVSRTAYTRLKDKLKTSMELGDVKALLDSIYKNLEAESKEVKLSSLGNIRELIEQFFKGGKTIIIRNIVEKLIEYSRKEEEKEIYEEYIKLLSEIGIKSITMEYSFLSNNVVSFFAGEVSSVEKAKVIVPYLVKFNSKEAINVLLSLLWEKDLREIVLKEVNEFGVDSVPYLMELLKDSEDKEVRFSLLKIIRGIGKPAVDFVRKYLHDPRWYVRRNAVLIIGSIGGREVLDEIYALKDDHPKVQIEIVRVLKHILKEDAESYLLPFLDSAYPEVQQYVLSTLQGIISEEGLKALNRRLLLNTFPREWEIEIKKLICDILAIKGNSESIDALSQIIRAKKVFGIPEFPEDLRYKATKAVAEIGGVKAEEILKSLTKDYSKKIRTLVLESLSKG